MASCGGLLTRLNCADWQSARRLATCPTRNASDIMKKFATVLEPAVSNKYADLAHSLSPGFAGVGLVRNVRAGGGSLSTYGLSGFAPDSERRYCARRGQLRADGQESFHAGRLPRGHAAFRKSAFSESAELGIRVVAGTRVWETRGDRRMADGAFKCVQGAPAFREGGGAGCS